MSVPFYPDRTPYLGEITGAIDGAGSSVFAMSTELVRAQATNAVTQTIGSIFYLNLHSAALGFSAPSHMAVAQCNPR